MTSLLKWLDTSTLPFKTTKPAWKPNTISIHKIPGFFLWSQTMKETSLIKKLWNMSCIQHTKLTVWGAHLNRLAKKLNLIKITTSLDFAEKKLVLCTTEVDTKLNITQRKNIGTLESCLKTVRRSNVQVLTTIYAHSKSSSRVSAINRSLRMCLQINILIFQIKWVKCLEACGVLKTMKMKKKCKTSFIKW